jgi:hypothetical protein
MQPDAARGPQRFAETLLALERELDWELLGASYCWEGGRSFFAPEQREAMRDAGLRFAGDLAELLGEPAGAGAARSLYVGPGVAELAPMLCERIVLGRAVLAIGLPGVEPDELNRALAAVGDMLGQRLFEIRTGGWEGLASGDADHGWLVSVLTDPEAFPALHDHLYRRTGALATGRGDLDEERARAEELVERVLDRLRPGALLSTTDEELGLVSAACRRRGWRLAVPDSARLSPVVGDPVRHCRIGESDERAAR